MSSAKQNILKRLKAAKHAPDAEIDPKWKPPVYDSVTRVEQFKATMEQSHTEFIETTEDDWAQQLTKLALKRNLKHWLISPSADSANTFTEHAAAHPNDIELTRYEQPVECFKERLFNHIDASLTDAHKGIAHTGTLVIIPSEAEPRLMSLVPPVHVVIMRESLLVNSFSELIEQQPWSSKGLPTNVLLVSGPSKTADIQQTLAYGAHGPKELIVLFIRNQLIK